MRAFTLVEIMVTIAIIVTLSGAILAYNRTNESQLILFRDRAIFVGTLNRAKALAIEKFNQTANVCAFGIYIGSARDYLIFGDRTAAPDCRDEAGNYTGNLQYDAGEAIQSFSLDPKLTFTGQAGLNVLFIAPDLTVTSTQPLPVRVGIETTNRQYSSLITIGEGGQIITQ